MIRSAQKSIKCLNISRGQILIDQPQMLRSQLGITFTQHKENDLNHHFKDSFFLEANRDQNNKRLG